MSVSKILCIGEILWDALPDGLFLGGAPLNVAAHLKQFGHECAVASRVGDDELGREIERRLERKQLSPEYIQRDDTLPTGFVIVSLDSQRVPTFEIVQPSAWDAIGLTPELMDAAGRCSALIFGSLAQRTPVSRKTIQTLIAKAPLRVFDVNFRPPFVDREVIEEGMRISEIVKLNDDELRGMAEWYDFNGELDRCAEALASEFDIHTLCVTRGAHGALLLHNGMKYDHPGCTVAVEDTVGSGDAFLASLVDSYLEDMLADPASAIARANATGAFVASRRGATPRLNQSDISELMSQTKVVRNG